MAYRTNRNLFSNYYLDEHLPETESWDAVPEEVLRSKRSEIIELWEQEKDTAPQRNEAQLEEKFIRPIFHILDITFEVQAVVERGLDRPDYAFFDSREEADIALKRAEDDGDFYRNAIGVADAKRWGRPLDSRGERKRDVQNPSHQIDVYMKETETRWAVLTNGKKWRLYFSRNSHRLDAFYEIDLPTLLEHGDLEDFKYFYLFFRRDAFIEDPGGDNFLDDVADESNIFAQELGEDLQDNIYEAIKVLAEGFLYYEENELSEEDLELIHDSSLIYLYRIIFVLYAEAEGRELLDTDNEIYKDSYSLNTLKQEIAEELDSASPKYRNWQVELWSQLDQLFRLIDQGSKSRDIDPDDFYIPAYNGGLFRMDPDETDSREARFLTEHPLGDSYLANVIELLTRSRNGNGDEKIFVDYSSLDVRHLGSIYEGLLEYRLNIAEDPLAVEDGEYVPAENHDEVEVAEGGVYLTTDSGERKATGSYYTPEYVVEYIVENTLEPLIKQIREDLVGQTSYQKADREAGTFAEEFAERVFELKILDPAMGSGHFLVNTVDYLAREVIAAKTKQDKQALEAGEEDLITDVSTSGDNLRDINWARRQVAQRCIYGVDVNPLATELAKVSLWLRTLAAEQPLAFLDHHLKTGNSLVGSDIEDVLDNGDPDEEVEAGQLTLRESFDRTRRQALDHVTDRFQELLAIDNETLEDVKEMEAVFDEVRDDPLYRHLLAMANVHTADAFGLDVPSDAYERMAAALRDDSWNDIEGQDWFRSAQAIAEEERFFHWELEFPVAFYGEDGERDEDAGFDAVIGNPPWLGLRTGLIDSQTVSYLKKSFSAAEGQFDLAAVFLEQGTNLIRKTRTIGFVVPKRIASNEIYVDLREHLAIKRKLTDAIDLGLAFEGVSNDALILISTDIESTSQLRLGNRIDDRELNIRYLEPDSVRGLPYNIIPVNSNQQQLDLVDQVNGKSDIEFGSIAEITRGAECGMNHDAISTDPGPNSIPAADPSEVGPYAVTGERYFIDTTEIEPEVLKDISLYLDTPKLLVRFLSDRLIVARDDEGLASTNLVYHIRTSHVGYYCGLLSSNLLSSWYMTSFQTEEEIYPHVQKSHIAAVPVLTYTNDCEHTNQYSANDIVNAEDPKKVVKEVGNQILKTLIPDMTKDIITAINERSELNTSILDYLGEYVEGPKLPDVGTFQPENPSILDSTSKRFEKLRFGDVTVQNDGDSITIKATARYKPENDEEFETNQHGYTETEYQKAFSLTGLSEQQAALIESFLPAVARKAGGFAEFRNRATKTISLLDRLKSVVVPEIDDIEDDLKRYMDTKRRADTLDLEIKKIDESINMVVYELYDISKDAREVAESTVEGSQD